MGKIYDPGWGMHNFGSPTVYIQYKGLWDMDLLYRTLADFMRQKQI